MCFDEKFHASIPLRCMINILRHNKYQQSIHTPNPFEFNYAIHVWMYDLLLRKLIKILFKNLVFKIYLMHSGNMFLKLVTKKRIFFE